MRSDFQKVCLKCVVGLVFKNVTHSGLEPGDPIWAGSACHKVQGQGSHLISPRPHCPVLYL